MKQIAITAPYEVEVREIDPPRISSDSEVLVKSSITGISAGTEMCFFRGTHPNLHSGKWNCINSFPIIPGYECVGTVVEKGSKVDHLDIGDRVICLGPHQEIVKLEANRVVRLPDSLPSEKALFSILNTTALYAVYRANPNYGDGVVVIGAGALGLLVFQNCRRAGAVPLVMADKDRQRLLRSQEIFDDGFLDLSEKNWNEELKHLFPRDVDLVIEVTGNPQAILTAIEIARAGGKVHIAGFHEKPCPILFGDDFLWKELTLSISFSAWEKAAYHPRYVRRPLDVHFPLSVRLIAEGKIQILEKWITHRFSYSEIGKAYQIIDKKQEDFLMIILNWD